MGDAHVVQVLDSKADVSHQLSGLALVEGLLLLDALKELATKHAKNRWMLVSAYIHCIWEKFYVFHEQVTNE